MPANGEVLCVCVCCMENNLFFKILLVVDNAPFIGDLHPNINMVFLSPNTTSLIKPMDQEVTGAFKAFYVKKTFA